MANIPWLMLSVKHYKRRQCVEMQDTGCHIIKVAPTLILKISPVSKDVPVIFCLNYAANISSLFRLSRSKRKTDLDVEKCMLQKNLVGI
jgi:hypothetical protein